MNIKSISLCLAAVGLAAALLGAGFLALPTQAAGPGAAGLPQPLLNSGPKAPDADPTVSINDVSLSEGNSGTTNFSFLVTLSAAYITSPVTVNYETAIVPSEAEAGSDFTTASGQVVIPAGQLSQPVVIAVAGDQVYEDDETFLVNLTAIQPLTITVADGQGLGTILNDEATPTFSVNSPSIAEGNAGSANLQFTVSLSPVSEAATGVAFATQDNTATTADLDYAASSGTLSFNALVGSRTVDVPVNGDTKNETNEQFFLNLSTASGGAVIGTAQGTGTITNDDALPSLSVSDVSQAEGNSGTTNFNFTVTLSAASGQQVTVNYATANGTAVAPGDYTALGSTALVFDPGQTSKTVTVQVNGDTGFEANETFSLNLSGAANATIADAQGTGTIMNDEGMPALSINDVTLVEGNSGSTNAVFTVTLSASSLVTTTVSYATANGTATAGLDYTATSGSLTFNPTQTTQTINVPVTGDTTDEANETFTVNLSNAINATIADGQGLGTITDDDGAPTISISNAAVTEGAASSTVNANFTVTLSASSGLTVTVNYATADGSAIAPGDYTAIPSTPLVFTPGQTSKTVPVVVKGDDLDEPNETFTVNLSTPVNATILDNQGTGTINDDDAEPQVRFSTTSQDIAENAGSVKATVTLVNAGGQPYPSGRTINVPYTLSGAAQAGSGKDYTAAPASSIQFAPGTTSQDLTLTILNDTRDEADETIIITLGDPDFANLAAANTVHTGTIRDNDAPNGLLLSPLTVLENQAIGTKVGDLTTDGEDVTYVYTKTATVPSLPGLSCADNAFFNLAGAVLQTAKVFDREDPARPSGKVDKYVVCLSTTDTDGLSYTAPFTITIGNVNEAPVAVADADKYELKQGELLDLTDPANAIEGVLWNDSDVDHDQLYAVLDTSPQHIQNPDDFVLHPNGDFYYKPDPNFVGLDSFTYHVEDRQAGGLASAPVKVEITTLDANSPTVTWVLPEVDDDNVFYVDTSRVLLKADAIDNVGVKYVRFYRWDAIKKEYAEIGNDDSAPYEVTLDATQLNMYWNEVRIEAYDNMNNKSPYKIIWLYRTTLYLHDAIIFMPVIPNKAVCDPSYLGACIPPPPPDLNCQAIPYRNFRVIAPDPHGFDLDHDGIGCEQ